MPDSGSSSTTTTSSSSERVQVTAGSPPHPPSLVPHWVKETVYVAGFIISITIFGQSLKSDQRSTRESLDDFKQDTREQITKISDDLSSIRASIPNKEASELRIRQLEGRIDALEGDLKFEAAKAQSMRERLIKRGWVE